MPSSVNRVNELRLFWNKYGPAILAYGMVPVATNSTGIGANTYRAFGKFVKRKSNKLPHIKPSELFNVWVKRYFKNHNLAQTKDFATFHKRACRSLALYWGNRSGKTLDAVPYASKLLDLHIKHIVWHQRDMSQSQQERLLTVVFQPLDSNSLLLMDELGIRLLSGKKIPKNASMGLIKTEAEYKFFQECVREICDDAEIPIFAFDHFAWNSRS